MDREEVKVDKKRKKEQCHYPAILIDQSWSIKDYYVAKRRTFSCGNDAENPECTRWVHLTCSGGQSEHRIRFIFPAHGWGVYR